MAKGALGATATALLGFIFGEPLPSLAAGSAYSPSAPPATAEPAFLPARAAAFGAARTGSMFAFAPFIGAALALLLERPFGQRLDGRGGVLMLAGILLHLAESHGHEHSHEALDHEHAHWHDDGHHEHRHEPMPEGVHSHRHRHEPLRHKAIHTCPTCITGIGIESRPASGVRRQRRRPTPVGTRTDFGAVQPDPCGRVTGQVREALASIGVHHMSGHLRAKAGAAD